MEAKKITTKMFRNGVIASFMKQIMNATFVIWDWENQKFIAEVQDTDDNRIWLKERKMI
jgi:hypothetical protein